MNTPLRRFKHFTEEGGIAAPFIVRYPAANLEHGRIEHDGIGDVIDLMPTIAEAAGATYPKTMDGRDLPPEEGISLMPLLKAATPTSRTLFWEHEGNRAVRIGDWKLVGPRGEPWKLFNMVEDRTELHDLTAQHPDKVALLHAAYDTWAARIGVEAWPIKAANSRSPPGPFPGR